MTATPSGGPGGIELHARGCDAAHQGRGGPGRVDEPLTWSYADLHVEAELHDVAVRHDVVLALDPDPTARLGLGHRSGLHELLEADDLGLDEATLEVGVDHAGCLGGSGALWDRPGAGL